MDIQAAKKRCEAATEGPWEFTDGFYGWDSGIFPVGCEDKLNQSIIANNGRGNGDPTEADAEFMARARSDLPAALEALEEAQGKLDAVEQWLEPSGVAQHHEVTKVRNELRAILHPKEGE
jgi:hypothetical protein